MTDFLNLVEMEKNVYTENGAVEYATSGNDLVDLNFSVPEIRKSVIEKNTKALQMFKSKFFSSYNKDPMYTLKWLMYLRDIKHGMGERDSFRFLFQFLSEVDADITIQLIRNGKIQELGRWDDLIDLAYNTSSKYVEEECLSVIESQLYIDCDNTIHHKPISLLAKWMPSINTSSKKTKAKGIYLKRKLGIKSSTYRKLLSFLRNYSNVLETKTSSNQWGSIEYGAVPSLANIKYMDAFMRHDEERRKEYLKNVFEGKEQIHANSMFLYDIVRKYLYCLDDETYVDDTLEALWKNQNPPNELLSKCLVIRDGSGSMDTPINKGLTAACVADSITLYCAEYCKSKEFKNKFITFSSRPEIVDVSMYNTLHDKLVALSNYNDCSNTDIEAVFKLILNTAIKNHLSQEDLPENLIIISDMEFDQATYASSNDSDKLFDAISDKYKENGYKLPRLIFWNVNSRSGGIPMTKNDNGLVLVSGFSKIIVDMICYGSLDPYESLVKVLDKLYPEIEKLFINNTSNTILDE